MANKKTAVKRDLDRLKSLVRAWSKCRILVVGDVGVDRYTIGSVERISPEAPVPIVRVEEEKLKLGLAANVADNVEALGGVPLLVGVIGKDRSAQDFRGLLKANGIASTFLVSDPSRRTVLKERLVSDRQQLLRVDYESQHAIGKAVEDKVLEKVLRLLPKVDAVILEDYSKGLLTERLSRAIIRSVTEAGKILAVDPNARTPVERYQGASVLTPNTREAEELAGIPIRDRKSLNRVGQLILAKTQAKHVVITRGKEGMAIFSAEASDAPGPRIIPTYAREVYDVSGAGDTVIAVLSLALAAGASIDEAAMLGNLAAGVEVGKRGTATVSPSEILDAMAWLKPEP